MQVYLNISIYINGYVQVHLHEPLSKKLVRSSYYLVQHWFQERQHKNGAEMQTRHNSDLYDSDFQWMMSSTGTREPTVFWSQGPNVPQRYISSSFAAIKCKRFISLSDLKKSEKHVIL